MSVLDQLRGVERQVLGRLRELRPLVDEYRDLEKVAERLGLRRDESAPADDAGGATSAPRAKAKAKPVRARAAKAAAKPRASKRTVTRPTAKPAARGRAAKPKPKPTAGRRAAAASG